MSDCRHLGVTGQCAAGRHDQCAYTPSGACRDGIWLPECYVTLPPKGGRRGADAQQRRFLDGVAAVLPGRGPVMVVRPSHRYHCPCGCHAEALIGAQLELFAHA